MSHMPEVYSEVWGSYKDKQVKKPMVIDHWILQAFIEANAKEPVKSLYFEKATLSIQHIISKGCNTENLFI